MKEATTLTETQSATEHRQAYGTAKTENLRDSGLWRLFLPLVVIGSCLALLAIPLIFLVPLLIKSFDPSNPANMHHQPLTWLWITMIALILIIDVVVIRGLGKIFFTQAGNYR